MWEDIALLASRVAVSRWVQRAVRSHAGQLALRRRRRSQAYVGLFGAHTILDASHVVSLLDATPFPRFKLRSDRTGRVTRSVAGTLASSLAPQRPLPLTGTQRVM